MLFPDEHGVVAMGLKTFEQTTGVKGFTIDFFEIKAEQYNQQYPGEGYQRAYEESLNRVFWMYLAKASQGDKNLSTLDTLVYGFDAFIMQPYLKGARAHGHDINLDLSLKRVRHETVKAFDDILSQFHVDTAMQRTADQFERGTLTLDSVRADLKARKNTTPTKEEALELVSRAAILEDRMKSRSGWDTFWNLFTVAKEYFTIRSLKELAGQAGNVADLEYEAETGNPYIAAVKATVDMWRIYTENLKENERIQKRSEELATQQEELEEALTLEQNDNQIEHNGRVDVGQIDDDFNINHEIDPEGEDPFTHLSEDPLDGPSFILDEPDGEKENIIIDELASQDISSQLSEKADESQILSSRDLSI